MVDNSPMTAGPLKFRESRIALVGMSGSGKTFWTKKLAEAGWRAISCDDLIEKRLGARLAAGNFSGIHGVAAWMGWPDDAGYGQREAEYLTEEIGALDEVLSELEKDAGGPLVLDTTGSVIYSPNHLLMRLRRTMTVVNLAASQSEQQLLVDRYLLDPKPVLWRGAFQPIGGESPHDAVARCYPALIAARAASYETLAHRTVQISELREAAGSPTPAAAFLEKIKMPPGREQR